MIFFYVASVVVFLTHFNGAFAERCTFPGHMQGNYYSEQLGTDVDTQINNDIWLENNIASECFEKGRIQRRDIDDDRVINNPKHAKFITVSTKNRDGQDTPPCYKCIWVLYRTDNILQFSTTSTCSFSYTPGRMESLCVVFPSASSLVTMYNKTVSRVNCKNTFEGVYQFTYEFYEGGGGICDHAGSRIEACQLPGTDYVENNVVDFTYMSCPEVSTSRNEKIRYHCLGSWIGEDNYTYAGLAKTVEKRPKERYRCLLTRNDQRPTDNRFRWVKSRFTECNKLINTYTGYQRLIVKPIPPRTKFMTPACNLPRNISGEWFTMGQFDTDVIINETHIYFRSRQSEFKYLETYYSCQQTYGTRYMMTSVTVGQCEVDYVCFDLMPRHHSIVRFRIGSPQRMKPGEGDSFRSTCNWLSFTRDRTKTEWKYQVLVLKPPTPVPCPIAGRYYFTQTPSNKIKTVHRSGVTERPRMQVDCRRNMSVMSSCRSDMSKIELDASYCETVDYKGRPIGEYDEPDVVMSCVGYWMEDMKSFMITYDEHDEESRYRCWVYKRVSWTELLLSRSSRAKCYDRQEAHSYQDGADLHLYVTESERLFDMCPQRFEDGYDPYKKPLAIYVIASAHHLTLNVIAMILSSSLVLLSL